MFERSFLMSQDRCCCRHELKIFSFFSPKRVVDISNFSNYSEGYSTVVDYKVTNYMISELFSAASFIHAIYVDFYHRFLTMYSPRASSHGYPNCESFLSNPVRCTCTSKLPIFQIAPTPIVQRSHAMQCHARRLV